jgi:hypothetical protein
MFCTSFWVGYIDPDPYLMNFICPVGYLANIGFDLDIESWVRSCLNSTLPLPGTFGYISRIYYIGYTMRGERSYGSS